MIYIVCLIKFIMEKLKEFTLNGKVKLINQSWVKNSVNMQKSLTLAGTGSMVLSFNSQIVFTGKT